MAVLQELTGTGFKKFEGILDKAKGDTLNIARQALKELKANLSEYSESVDNDIDIEAKPFKTRFEAGEYLVRKLSTYEGIIRNKKMWAWLSLYYIDSICPDLNSIYNNSRYIPSFNNWKNYYRHLLYGPYSIYHAHQNNPKITLAVLCTPVDKPGDIVEQLASRQFFISAPPIMEVATRLYFDPKTSSHKTGAASKDGTKSGEGGVRRLIHLIRQLDLTYDLYSIDAGELLELLPPEFDRFKS